MITLTAHQQDLLLAVCGLATMDAVQIEGSSIGVTEFDDNDLWLSTNNVYALSECGFIKFTPPDDADTSVAVVPTEKGKDAACELKRRTRSVLVLDDEKYLDYVLKRQGLYTECFQIGPEQYRSVSLARNMHDAVSLVKRNPKFDLWVLDRYLRDAVEGGELLEEIAEACPEKLPDEVWSCSSMPGYDSKLRDLFSKAKEKSCPKN